MAFRVETKEKKLFLTFDDGPVPEATPEVLQILSMSNAKATFFCIGQNVERYPEIFRHIIKEGHAVGNHTFHHLNGWKASREKYLDDTDQCKRVMNQEMISTNPKPFFRPPYGKLTPFQFVALKRKFRIVMWDVLARDWEQHRNPQSCFARIKNNAVPGSIVVFHDSVKAKSRMVPALQMTLNYFTEMGYSFETLEKYI